MAFENWLFEHESSIRLSFFVIIFVLVALIECLLPRRIQHPHRRKRWLSNLSIVLLDSMLVRLIVPVGLFAIALQLKQTGWGLFNIIELNWGWSFVLSVILLDLAIYWQHRLFHAVPILWCLHRVHHSDHVYDVSTGLRFHPIEILLSTFIKIFIIILFGVPASAIIVFEVVLNGVAMFNHGNIRLPKALDGVLRILIVTPDMHRVHHSTIPGEYNSNYGFNISLWDRLFHSYVAQPQNGHDRMEIGLKEYPPSEHTSSLMALLKMPFVNNK